MSSAPEQMGHCIHWALTSAVQPGGHMALERSWSHHHSAVWDGGLHQHLFEHFYTFHHNDEGDAWLLWCCKWLLGYVISTRCLLRILSWGFGDDLIWPSCTHWPLEREYMWIYEKKTPITQYKHRLTISQRLFAIEAVVEMKYLIMFMIKVLLNVLFVYF